MGLRPLHDRILVDAGEESRQRGSIIIPDTAKEKPQQASSWPWGLGGLRTMARSTPLDVKVGTKWSSGNTPGPKSKSTAKSRLIIREDDVLGILE